MERAARFEEEVLSAPALMPSKDLDNMIDNLDEPFSQTLYDNAVVENFFGMLKTECIYPSKPQMIAQARQLVQLYMDFYNGERMALK